MLAKIGINILISSLLCSLAFAECDFSKVEKKDNHYQYSVACHIEVGNLYDLNVSQARLLEIVNEDSKYWEAKAIKYKNKTDYPFWVTYGLGVVATLTSVWAAGQISR